MKNMYLIFVAILLVAAKVNAQITAIPTANNAENSSINFNYKTSARDDSAFSHVHILPNLAMGKIIVTVDDANTNVIEQGECVVFNSGGTPVAKSPFTTGTNEIYVNTLPTGMYFIRLMQKNGAVAVRKFVVTR